MANDRVTYFYVDYDLTDVSAKQEMKPSTDDNISFADINNLPDETTEINAMTFEKNVSVLDGSLPEFDKSATYSFFSSEIGDADGRFTVNPTITIDFVTYHSSFGFTFSFLPIHPQKMRITWYKDINTLASEEYTVTSDTFVVQTDVALYNKIVIEFTQSAPYAYIKLQNIQFGLIINWDENIIKQASLVEELNGLSDKLSINTLSFDIVDKNDDINFGNAEGMHNYFQRYQKLRPYETVNDEVIPLGTFFLDTFSSEPQLGKMKAVSYMGILDSIQFNEGKVYNGTLAGEILSQILEIAEVDMYTIDAKTYNQPIYGTIPPMSCRNALREVLFACNSVIDTTDPDMVTVSKKLDIIDKTITRNIKFSTKATKEEYYTGVEVKYSSYSLSNDVTEISKGEYVAGTYQVLFSQPYTDITVSNGTIIKSAPYYVQFTVATDGEVVISGKGYNVTNPSVTAERGYIAPGQYQKIKSFTTTLCNSTTAEELAEKLLTYYVKNSLKLNVKYLADDVIINIRRVLDNSTKGMSGYVGRYTKRTLDLTGGFVDTAELVGYFDTSAEYYYAGDEIYADDDFLL